MKNFLVFLRAPPNSFPGRSLRYVLFFPSTVILSISKESWYLSIVLHLLVNTGRRESRLSAVRSAKSINSLLTLVHPFATSWLSSPKGDARD